ncbi:MAG TPA: DUF2520 domain-containing protein [Candidatus Wallbacteria bacterium]|nr:DUF2520 domain-containing protein [Candidatus Wallbacteria bacterium]
MGQVPFYVIIGGGRLASHLSNYFTLKKIEFSQWTRNSGVGLPEHISHIPPDSIVLLAVSDGAIAQLVEEHAILRKFSPVHFSGCVSVAGVTGVHPLTSFTRSSSGWGLHDYEMVPFVLEKGGAGFEDIFPCLDNPHYYINAEQKPLYHALCVAAGNFTTMLWGEAMRQFSDILSLPPEILHPYMDRVSANIKSEGPAGLTGPLVRGDIGTIEQNIKAIKGTPLERIYLSFLGLAGISISTGGDIL